MHLGRRYLRVARSLSMVSGVFVVAGCGATSTIPTSSTDASTDASKDSSADVGHDAGACVCFGDPDAGVRACGSDPGDPPCAVPGPMPPPELPSRRRVAGARRRRPRR